MSSNNAVFISHSKSDSEVAEALVAILEKEEINCWIAPRNISPGKSWAESIVDGIYACRIMILLLSESSNQSVQVIREIEHAVNQRKILVTIRLSDVSPSKAMLYFISSQQWIDAFPKGLSSIQALLVHTLKNHLLQDEETTTTDPLPKKEVESKSKYELSIKEVLKESLERGGDKLILTVGAPPTAKINGKYVRFDLPTLSPANVMDLCTSLMKPFQKDTLVKNKLIAFNFGLRGISRYSIVIHFQRGCWNAVIDTIPYELSPLSNIFIDSSYSDLLKKPRGTIIVGGTTESAKNELLHSLINYINENYCKLIFTIDSTISFVHHHLKSTVQQIDINSDAISFKNAFSAAWQSAPDVISIDNLNDTLCMHKLIDFGRYQGNCIISQSNSSISYDIDWNLKTLLDRCSSYASAEYILSSLSAIVTLDIIWNSVGKKIYLPRLLILNDKVRKEILESDNMSKQLQVISNATSSRNKALVTNYKNGDLTKDEAIMNSYDKSNLIKMMNNS